MKINHSTAQKKKEICRRRAWYTVGKFSGKWRILSSLPAAWVTDAMSTLF